MRTDTASSEAAELVRQATKLDHELKLVRPAMGAFPLPEFPATYSLLRHLSHNISRRFQISFRTSSFVLWRFPNAHTYVATVTVDVYLYGLTV
jgi:hypothetical protein